MGIRTLIFSLPVPPSANGFYSVYRGRKIMSKRARLWHKEAYLRIHQQLAMLSTGQRGWDTEKTYALTLCYTPGSRRIQDCDSPIKATMDALTQSGAIWGDDRQVVELHAYRLPVAKPGGLRAQIVIIEDRGNKNELAHTTQSSPLVCTGA